MHLRLFVGDDNQQNNKPLEYPRPANTPVTADEQLLGQYIPLHYHFNMLQDEYRVGAFAKAIQAVIKPGMHVVELGGGTGILSWLAAQQGAQVTCVERNPALVKSARELLKKNRHGDRVTVIQADARDYIPTEPADVVICEMLHSALLREKQTEVIQAYKNNYAAAFGLDAELPKFFPEATTMLVQPIDFSYDFAGYQAPLPLFQDPAGDDSRTTMLGELTTYANVFYDEQCATEFAATLDIAITHSGKLSALRFATQNLITILVEEQRGIPWANQYLVLPVQEPVEVTVGDTAHIEFSYTAGADLESLIDSLTVTARTNVLPLNEAA